MISYCAVHLYAVKVFVTLLFPPAAILLGLLVCPLPRPVTKYVLKITDAVLFWRPHPHVPLSLFYLVLLLSFLTFAEMMMSVREHTDEYQKSKEFGGGRTEKAHIKLLAEQRNAWISGFAFVLWVLLHRYRSLLKNNYFLQDKLAERVEIDRRNVLELEKQKKALAATTVAPVAPKVPESSAPPAPKSDADKKDE